MIAHRPDLEVDPFRSNLPNFTLSRFHGPVLHGLHDVQLRPSPRRAVLHDRRRRRGVRSRRRSRDSSKTYGTAAIGGGLKFFFSPHFALRGRRTLLLDGRGIADVLLRLRLLLHRSDLGVELRGQRRLHHRLLASGGDAAQIEIRRSSPPVSVSIRTSIGRRQNATDRPPRPLDADGRSRHRLRQPEHREVARGVLEAIEVEVAQDDRAARTGVLVQERERRRRDLPRRRARARARGRARTSSSRRRARPRDRRRRSSESVAPRRSPRSSVSETRSA